MAWHHSANEAIGEWVAKNAPRPSAYAPFLVLYERLCGMSESYLAARTAEASLSEVHLKLWQAAWSRSAEFQTSQSYIAWLLTLAEEVIAAHHTELARNPNVASTSSQQAFKADLEACLATLTTQHRTLARAFVIATPWEELCRDQAIDSERADRWLKAAQEQLQRCLGMKRS